MFGAFQSHFGSDTADGHSGHTQFLTDFRKGFFIEVAADMVGTLHPFGLGQLAQSQFLGFVLYG